MPAIVFRRGKGRLNSPQGLLVCSVGNCAVPAGKEGLYWSTDTVMSPLVIQMLDEKIDLPGSSLGRLFLCS